MLTSENGYARIMAQSAYGSAGRSIWFGLKEEVSSISAGDYRVNEQIRGVTQVRLIVQGQEGKSENLGIVPLREAMNIAADRGLDLVEVSPDADPPVCRVMDFSKFLYERSKKEREARKAQKTIEVKEIRLRPKTNDHHLSFKVRDARKWLADGMKVKVRIRFRGREITYPEIAREQLNEIAEVLQDIAIVEQAPNMDGKTMLMVLAPSPDKDKKK
jgi:translation initiation factor IF-3